MILFFSDLHIDPFKPNEGRQKKLIEYLNSISDVEEIFFVGDVFDFWFEYRYMIPSGYIKILDTFVALIKRGIRINLIRGNHDMWAGETLEDLGIKVYDQKRDFLRYGLQIHLAHGDFLDKTIPNRLTQICFHSRFCQTIFSYIPHVIGFPFACHVAQRNRNFKLRTSLLNEFENFARKKIADGSDLVILGHLHYPVLKCLKKGIYVNVGDWIKNLTFLQLNSRWIFLKNFLDENLDYCKISRFSERRLVCQSKGRKPRRKK